jgi:hypothetical protein
MVGFRGIHHALVIGMTFIGFGCSGDATAPVQREQPPPSSSVTITNRLDVPVTLSSGGTVLGSLARGESTVVVLTSGPALLTWVPAQRVLPRGGGSDDLDGSTMWVTPQHTALSISNIVGNTHYITPYVTSAVADTVWLRLEQGGSVPRCLGYQVGVTTAPVQWGYYRLTSGTTLRAYAGADCTGAFREWKYEQLTRYEGGTGIVRLHVDRLPEN